VQVGQRQQVLDLLPHLLEPERRQPRDHRDLRRRHRPARQTHRRRHRSGAGSRLNARSARRSSPLGCTGGVTQRPGWRRLIWCGEHRTPGRAVAWRADDPDARRSARWVPLV